MGKQTIVEIFKEKIASIGWKLFLWGSELTEEEYFKQIHEQEERMKNESK